MIEAQSNESFLRILTIAELHWRNGHEYALQAMQLLQQRGVNFEYRIVGDGPFLEAVAFARYELGLKENTRIISNTSLEQKDRCLSWANVFILAAVREGAWHGLHEAISRKIHVICTDVPALKEHIVEGVNGFVVPRRNPAALVDRLVERVFLADASYYSQRPS